MNPLTSRRSSSASAQRFSWPNAGPHRLARRSRPSGMGSRGSLRRAAAVQAPRTTQIRSCANGLHRAAQAVRDNVSRTARRSRRTPRHARQKSRSVPRSLRTLQSSMSTLPFRQSRRVRRSGLRGRRGSSGAVSRPRNGSGTATVTTAAAAWKRCRRSMKKRGPMPRTPEPTRRTRAVSPLGISRPVRRRSIRTQPASRTAPEIPRSSGIP